MSWVTIRNSVESLFSPLEQKAITFAETLETDFAGTETTGLEAAFAAATASYASGTGTTEEKGIAALEAFGTSLLGYGISVVKTAASQSA